MPDGRAKRSYTSEKRATGAAQKRNAIIVAAITMLRHERGIGDFTLDAVARSAGVTRLTVYNQFSNRRGLLEAVFEELSQTGGIARLAEAAAHPDPLHALDRVIETYCRFWCSDRAIARIYDAIATDPEIAEALEVRISRGRTLIVALVDRAAVQLSEVARSDAADLLSILTDLPTVARLSATRDVDQVIALLQRTCRRLMDPMEESA